MSPSRRSVLAAVAGSVAGLAGCNADVERSQARSGTTGRDADPTVHRVRNPGGDRVVSDPGGVVGVVADRPRAESLQFADGVPDDAVADARAFLRATDFDDQSVFVYTRQIESCYRLRVKRIVWTPRRFDVERCTQLRPPDERCAADQRDALALLFRVDDRLGTEITSVSSSGGTCSGDVEYAVLNETTDSAGDGS